ncbi:MAG TPA: LysM peptidoglycan-binding domain-containing protein [Candidatus Limnocylindrales bacterium]
MASDDAVRVRGGAAGAAADAVMPRPTLPMLDESTRSPNPDVCPFFRRQVDGVLFAPLGSPDEENACAAIGVPKPQSARQQELVCLRAAHADCPRYLRGAMAYPEPPRPRRQAAVPRATLAALLILVLSAGISFGFVVQRGGIELPVVAAAPSSTAIAVVASASPAAASVAPSVIASSSPTTGPTPSPSPTSSPTPSATPSPTPSPTPKPTKKPTSDRYKLLKPCPNQDNCWIYTVRSGDNLSSIANYFGHSLKTIYKWNPQYPGTALRVGAQIRMPPPTR